MATIKLTKAITKRKNKIQVWVEPTLMIGEYDHRTVRGRLDMDRDIELTKKVLAYHGYKVVLARKVVQQQ